MTAKLRTDVEQDVVDRFRQDGFTVVENIVSGSELAALSRAVDAISHDTEAYPDVKRQWVRSDDEEHVGHIFYMHKHHEALLELTKHPAILAHVEAFLGGPVRLYSTQIMLKSPHEKRHIFQPHQDCYFWRFMPPKVVTCWFAFDDVTRENGCLTVGTGSHHMGLVDHVEYSSAIADNDGTTGALWCVPKSVATDLTMAEAPVGGGGGVFFTGLTVHASTGNTTDGWRRAAGIIYMLEENASHLTDEQLSSGW